MSVDAIVATVTAIASLSALSSLGILFKINADNRKTLAEANKIDEESNDIAFERLLELYDRLVIELETCKESLATKPTE